MIIIFGLIIGFCYSLISVTNMILTARYILLNGIGQGIYAALGTTLAQIVWMIAGILFLGLVGFHSGGHDEVNPAYFVMPGAFFIFYIAAKIYRSPLPDLKTEIKQSHLAALGLLFVVSITKYMRFMGYAGLYALSGAHVHLNHTSSWLPILIGSIIGVVLFWFSFVMIVAHFKTRVSPEGIHRFSKIGAIIIALIGVVSIASLWF